MTSSVRTARLVLACTLVATLIAGLVYVVRGTVGGDRTELVGYFDNSNGLFVGDDVRILGVNVGKVSRIEAQPDRVKISFWVDAENKIPAEADAVIVSPSVVSARAVQLTPAYTSGPTMTGGTTIPQDRTAVPVEWDDVRVQLKTLSDTLQPTEPGGVSTLGALINTTADNLRGEGANIRDTLIKLSAAFSALGDHSGDIFATIKNLSLLVSTLHQSSDLTRQLNRNLAAVTAQLADDPNEVSSAITDFSTAIGDVREFIEANHDALGITTDKLTSISQALADSIPDVKQTLHILPSTLQNFSNIYHPAQGGITGTAVLTASNPIQFICGAVQAASRLGAEQSAKLCAQYLAPIVKNRQYNFLPIGTTLNPLFILPVAGATARPNELTYSEDWMRPDYNPATAERPADIPATAAEANTPPGAGQQPPPSPPAALPAEAPISTDPSDGLPGLMVPPGQR